MFSLTKIPKPIYKNAFFYAIAYTMGILVLKWCNCSRGGIFRLWDGDKNNIICVFNF